MTDSLIVPCRLVGLQLHDSPLHPSVPDSQYVQRFTIASVQVSESVRISEPQPASGPQQHI